MSSSRESRLRRVIKQPDAVCPATPHITERVARSSVVDRDTDPAEPAHVDEVRREAFDDGRRAGLEEAMASIAMRRAASVEQLCSQLAAAAERAAASRAAIVEEVVGDVAALAADVVETLVGAVEWPETPARTALARALALAPRGPELVARVHPDAGLSEQDVAALTDRTGVQLVVDHSVDPAGCVVEVGSCTIDAQRSAALARVRDQFQRLVASNARQAVAP